MKHAGPPLRGRPVEVIELPRADGRITGRLAMLAAAAGQRVSPGDTVLDLGCGTGELVRHLAATGLRVTGCDISAPMLHRAARAAADGSAQWARLSHGWRELPFPRHAFDLVMASSVLECTDHPAAVLRECGRVLAPGGTLLCTVPDVRHPVHSLEGLAGLAAMLWPAAVAGHAPPRLRGYLAYLRVPRQRHALRWWQAAADQAGLRILPARMSPSGCSPVRLLALQRPGTGTGTGQEPYRRAP